MVRINRPTSLNNMDGFDDRVGNLADPFVNDPPSPASAPTPTNRTTNLTGSDKSHSLFHELTPSPAGEHLKHLFEEGKPGDIPNSIYNKLRSLPIESLAHLKGTIEEILRIHEDKHGVNQKLAARLFESVKAEDMAIPPELSPNASSASSYSINTPSPVRADRLGKPSPKKTPKASTQQVLASILPTSMPDDELSRKLEGVYKPFGECWITVTRDKKGLPGAFIQFTQDDHASVAIEKTPTMAIAGRRLRSERPKANFTLLVSKVDSSPIAVKELVELFQKQGPIDKMWRPNETDCAVHSLPPGCVCVRFFNFADYQDARRSSISSATITIQPLTKYGPKRVDGPASPAVASTLLRINDATSVFVGNLRCDCQTAELSAMFGAAGRVINIQKFKCTKDDIQKFKLTKDGANTGTEGTASLEADRPGSYSYYAFVEYADPQSVVAAIKHLNGAMLRGYSLRVELRANVKKEVNRMHVEINKFVGLTLQQTGECPNNATVLAAFPALLGTSLAVNNGVFRPQPPTLSAIVPYYVLFGN